MCASDHNIDHFEDEEKSYNMPELFFKVQVCVNMNKLVYIVHYV